MHSGTNMHRMVVNFCFSMYIIYMGNCTLRFTYLLPLFNKVYMYVVFMDRIEQR